MYEIVNKHVLTSDVLRMDIKAPLVASKASAGQCVMIQPTRNELTFVAPIVEFDRNRGLISIMIEDVNRSRHRIGQMQINDMLEAVSGPLGKKLSFKDYGNVACIASDLGIAQILPICRALKKEGNKVYGVIGAQTRKKLILEAQIQIATEKIWITTEDGSYQRKGSAINGLKEILDTAEISHIFTAGSIELFQEVTQLASAKDISVSVLIQPMDSCGISKCNSCRIRIGDSMKLICQEGADFNGLEIDFNFLKQRMNSYQYKSETQGPSKIEEKVKRVSGLFSGLLKK